MRQHWRLLAVLLLLLPCVCHAAMQSLSVENDDRPGFLLGSFGYNTGGVLELELKNMEVPLCDLRLTFLPSIQCLHLHDTFQLLVQHNFGNKNTYNISLVLQRSLNTGATQTLGNCQLSPTQSDFVFMLDTRARFMRSYCSGYLKSLNSTCCCSDGMTPKSNKLSNCLDSTICTLSIAKTKRPYHFS
jgi:hypothetical protein